MTHDDRRDMSMGLFFVRSLTKLTVDGLGGEAGDLADRNYIGANAGGGVNARVVILDCDDFWNSGSACGDALLVKCSTNKFFAIFAGMCMLAGVGFLVFYIFVPVDKSRLLYALLLVFTASFCLFVVLCIYGTRREPFNFTPMAVNPISSGSPHVRPTGRTCGESDEIKKNTHPKHVTALFGEQVSSSSRTPTRRRLVRPPAPSPRPPPQARSPPRRTRRRRSSPESRRRLIWRRRTSRLSARRTSRAPTASGSTKSAGRCSARRRSMTSCRPSRRTARPTGTTSHASTRSTRTAPTLCAKRGSAPTRRTTRRGSCTRRKPFNFTPHGGQFDFAWLPARTMHPHGAYVW